MEISKLSKDTAISVIQYWLDNKMFDLTDIKHAIENNPTDEIKRTVDFVHRILCTDLHTLDETTRQGSNREHCGYDGESIFDDCWTMPFHKHWKKRTLSLMSELEISNEAQLQVLFNRAQPTLAQLATLETEEPAAYLLVLMVKNFT